MYLSYLHKNNVCTVTVIQSCQYWVIHGNCKGVICVFCDVLVFLYKV